MATSVVALMVLGSALFGQVVEENFNGDLSAWRIWKNASRVQEGGNGYLQLTPEVTWQRGQAWYGDALPATWFVADFQFRIRDTGQASHADGLTFGWVESIPQQDDPNLGGVGHGLGAYKSSSASGYEGYFLEVDTWQNGSYEGASVQVPHIALMRSYSDTNPQLLAVYQPFDLTYNHWYDMRVALEPTGQGAKVSVWYDATADGQIPSEASPIISHLISDYGMGSAYFGFTAATGAAADAHDIDNFRLCVTPEVEPVILLMATAALGIFLKRRHRVDSAGGEG